MEEVLMGDFLHHRYPLWHIVLMADCPYYPFFLLIKAGNIKEITEENFSIALLKYSGQFVQKHTKSTITHAFTWCL